MAAAGVALGVSAIVATWPVAPYPGWVWLPIQLPGISFIVSGAVLRWHRPANRIGLVMMVAGFAWYVGDLQLSPAPALFAIGFCLFHVNYAALGHLVLLLPTGTLRSRYERGLVTLLYAAVPITQVPRLIVEYPPVPQGWGEPGRVSWLAAVGSAAMLTLTLLTVPLLVRRWTAAGPLVRREYAPVWMTMLVTAGVVMIYVVTAVLHVPDEVARYLFLLYALGMAVIPASLAAGLLRVWLSRIKVADLVVRLQRGADPGEVRAAMADALSDPALRILFARTDGPGYVDEDGAPANEDDIAGARTLVRPREEVLALLVHDPAVNEHPRLVQAVLAAAALALDNARLLAAQRTQLLELRASRARLVVAADQERRRIQRDLHDGAQHKLLVTAIHLDRARSNPQAADGHLDKAIVQVQEVLGELRALAEGIHPPVLSEQGLQAAADVLAERAPLPVTVRIPGRRWPQHIERAAYFVIAEALSNVYKHAGATQAAVRADQGDGGALRLEITDDGTGGATTEAGRGLRGIEDRVAALGGVLCVHSPPRQGTRISVELPCE
ncbi:sensor histidine kinase [Streptosporangiaceae bacterium NEAU-GS5]|nr:sensor histidine kinase [Streptosporangiaceae bacterium NEAU-GS5]